MAMGTGLNLDTYLMNIWVVQNWVVKMFHLNVVSHLLNSLAGEQYLLDVPAADNCQVD